MEATIRAKEEKGKQHRHAMIINEGHLPSGISKEEKSFWRHGIRGKGLGSDFFPANYFLDMREKEFIIEI